MIWWQETFFQNEHTHTHTGQTHTGLMVILPGKPGLTGFPESSSPVSIHPLVKHIPQCPSQTEEGTVTKKDEWIKVHSRTG